MDHFTSASRFNFKKVKSTRLAFPHRSDLCAKLIYWFQIDTAFFISLFCKMSNYTNRILVNWSVWNKNVDSNNINDLLHATCRDCPNSLQFPLLINTHTFKDSTTALLKEQICNMDSGLSCTFRCLLMGGERGGERKAARSGGESGSQYSTWISLSARAALSYSTAKETTEKVEKKR